MDRAVTLRMTQRTDPRLLGRMEIHYSQPKGFVGRNICYSIEIGKDYFGHIVGGSATLNLPGRDRTIPLNQIVNNIFFNISGPYPFRNFVPFVLSEYRKRVEGDWARFYNDEVLMHETLVQVPRTGECYRRDGWKEVGKTIGYTCKRVAGKGSDSWGGQRVWGYGEPKIVLTRKP